MAGRCGVCSTARMVRKGTAVHDHPPMVGTNDYRSSPNVRRVARRLLIGAGSVCAVLIGVALVLMVACEPPSPAQLERRFSGQRGDLATLVAMSDHDSQLVRIAPAWLEVRGGRLFMDYSAETGITRDRWDEYRRVFARNDIREGVQRDPDTGDIFVIVKAVGLLERGHMSGFLYCGPGSNHRYQPCASSQSSGDHSRRSGDDDNYSYRRLADRWYAYSEGPG